MHKMSCNWPLGLTQYPTLWLQLSLSQRIICKPIIRNFLLKKADYQGQLNELFFFGFLSRPTSHKICIIKSTTSVPHLFPNGVRKPSTQCIARHPTELPSHVNPIRTWRSKIQCFTRNTRTMQLKGRRVKNSQAKRKFSLGWPLPLHPPALKIK